MIKHDPEHQSALEAWREGRETRTIVTPFAFKVDESLLGRPLGKPWRRGLAILLDLWLISLLTYVPDVAVALAAAIATWMLARRRDQVVHAWARRWLRALAALTIFVVVVVLGSMVRDSLPSKSHKEKSQSHSALEVLQLGATSLGLAACKDKSCVDDLMPPLKQVMDEKFADQPDAKADLAKELFEDMDFLSAEDKAGYRQQLLGTPSQPQAELDLPACQAKLADVEAKLASCKADPPKAKKADKSFSLLGWIKGVAKDLGLGLSWAALYFSLFTALWRGQTPGKKLFKLRVVRLNGEPLTLWGAFGRYGGYGAGLATGMLGFLQVYWDSNRQCIQDKIGETVVVQDGPVVCYTDGHSGDAIQQQEDKA
ncbi:RDD family protein [Gallaecimonas kandeliae]|uniref:RDD family protein n=1 Tax=Gallaecimonas kandeliae TaxID=3029055 RepID=UPI0026489C47|nr:RDD family protein [Gallaecimonas kandeliae]WKE64301.1 RDD family protein [Gallaecimonas kandeliae]